jgi:hypothetical protein
MPDLKQQATDPELEKAGAWFECDVLPPDELQVPDETRPGATRTEYRYARMKLARINSKAYEDLEQELITKHRQRLRAGGKTAQAAQIEIATQLLSECVVIDWENVDWNGEPLLCTPENVRMMFRLPGVGRDLREWVATKAREREPYQLRNDEAAQGN